MSAYDEARRMNEERMQIWSRGRELLDRAENRGGLSAADRQAFDEAMVDLDRIDKQRDALLSSDASRREFADLNEEFRRAVTPSMFDAVRDDEKVKPMEVGTMWSTSVAKRVQRASLMVQLKPSRSSIRRRSRFHFCKP